MYKCKGSVIDFANECVYVVYFELEDYSFKDAHLK